MQSYKLFQAAVAAHILGKKTNFRFKGDKEKVTVTENVILASKKLYNELNSSNSDIETVTELIEQKRTASKKFLNAVGVPWML